MRLRAAISGVTLLAACWSGSGLAQQSDDVVLSTAREWGGNRDGVYCCDEWRAYLKRMYHLADVHRRGFIEAKDFEIVRRVSPVFAQASFDYFDQAGKGRVTQKEFENFPSPFFARFDKRHSCRVTQEEIRQANAPAPTTPTQRRGGGGRGGMGGGGRGEGGFGGRGM